MRVSQLRSESRQISSSLNELRLFSNDGTHSIDAQQEPLFIYEPDDSTKQVIAKLYSALETCIEHDNKIEELPFFTDLLLLRRDDFNRIPSLGDVTEALCRIATHFISRHEIIQSRVNAYLRCKLAGAELAVTDGTLLCLSEQIFERDQILLSSATTTNPQLLSPRSAVFESNAADESGVNYQRKIATDAAANNRVSSPPPPGFLLRSQSVNQQHIESYATHVFVMEDQTVSTLLGFLPSIFDDDNIASRARLSELDSQRLNELWEFFDFNMDGIVSRDDLIEGFSNIAKHFLVSDELTQLLTNSYIQKKVRRAMLSIERSARRSTRNQSSSSGRSNGKRSSSISSTDASVAEAFKEGDTVIFIDQEGNRHAAKVLRRSQRLMEDSVAYYVKTKGIKLYVSVRRLRLPNAAEDAAMIAEQQHQTQSTPDGSPHSTTRRISGLGDGLIVDDHREYRMVAQMSHLRLHDNSETTECGDNSTSKQQQQHQQQQFQQQTMKKSQSKSLSGSLQDGPSPSNASGKGILGYLRSSFAAVSKGTLRVTPVQLNAVKSEENVRSEAATAAVSTAAGAVVPVLSTSSSQPSSPNTVNGSTTPRQGSRFHPGTVVPTNDDSSALIEGNSNSNSHNSNTGSSSQQQQLPAESRFNDAVLVLDDDADSVYGGDSSVVFNDQGSTSGSRNPTADAAAARGFSGTPRDDGSNSSVSIEAPESLAVSAAAAVTALESRSSGSEPAAAVPMTAEEQTALRIKSSELILSIDAKILQVVRKVIGPQLRITRPQIPKPKKIEPYPIYFNRGKNGFFEFNQVDYGVQFLPFLDGLIPVEETLARDCADCIRETNRCFFLHFGVAMGFHPFALQHCFRRAAVELLQHPENEMTVFFGEALESLLLRNDFVDAQVLSAIWPIEFDRFKILIVRVDQNGRIESFNSFRSEVGPVDEFGEWAGEELIFTLQWNHFTVLKPKSEQLHKPITAVLAAASMIGILPLEFIVNVSSDPTARFRIIDENTTAAATVLSSVISAEAKGVAPIEESQPRSLRQSKKPKAVK